VIKRLVLSALLVTIIALPTYADFAAVARAIDGQRGVDRVWIPFLGLARAVVRVVRPEGVHDFQLVTFTNTDKVDAQELRKIMQEKAGPGFKPLVQVWSRRSGDWSFIYARPSANADRMELMILASDDEEQTVLVRVDIDMSIIARELGDRPSQMAKLGTR